MTLHRQSLPQLSKGVFLTDGGIETTLIFHDGLDLPHFAAFDLFKDAEGTAALERYFRSHASIALTNNTGFIFESATWRASPDWGEKLGYSQFALAAANWQAIDMLSLLRQELATENTAMVISGCVGPRGDGYDPGAIMSAEEAQNYHRFQADIFAATDADMMTAITMTNTPEAIGVTRAAVSAGLPVAISFTVETDGRLPTGQLLREAVEQVDAETKAAPAYYMINCAHPTHFESVLEDEAWMRRIRGIRANASKCSHAELDEAEDLDDGDPREFGQDHARLRARFPWLNVFGGCCGTDPRHIQQICEACLEPV